MPRSTQFHEDDRGMGVSDTVEVVQDRDRRQTSNIVALRMEAEFFVQASLWVCTQGAHRNLDPKKHAANAWDRICVGAHQDTRSGARRENFSCKAGH